MMQLKYIRMERKPPLVTSISNLLGFLYAYLDVVSLISVLGIVFAPSSYGPYFQYTFYIIISLWIFGLLAGRYSLDRIFGYRFVVVIGVLSLLVPLFIQTDVFVVGVDQLSGISTIFTAIILYFIVSNFGVQARYWLYWLITATALMLVTVMAIVAGEVPITALSLLILGCYWLGFARKELVLRVGAVGLIAVIVFYVISLSPQLIPVPLMLALLVMLLLQRNGLVLIPLSALVYVILSRGEVISLWVSSFGIWIENALYLFNINYVKEIFIGGSFYEGFPLYQGVLFRYGLVWLIFVFVMFLRINLKVYANFKKTLMPSVKYGNMLTIGMSILLFCLLFDQTTTVTQAVWMVYVWYIGLSVVKQEIP